MRRVPLTGLVVLLGVVGSAAGIRAGAIGDQSAETPGVQTAEPAPGHGKVGAATEMTPGATAHDFPSPPPGLPARSSVSGAPANSASLPASTRPAPALTEKPVKQPLPPITFFVAKGEPHACGRDCAEWIGADGMFDLNAPQRLRALLSRLGRRKLPIYFHSPGGSVAAALAIGRLMRERELTAGVAWTVPQGCDPKEPREPACDKLKRSGRELPAQLETGRTMCNSACVYALVGAAVRDVGPGASLGVHSSAITFINSHTHAPTRPAPHLVRAAMVAGYERIASYLRDMGIDPALLRAAREIENDRVRFLTRAEIWRFNIDRRSVVESDWKLVEQPVRAIRKVFLSDLKGGHTDYRS